MNAIEKIEEFNRELQSLENKLDSTREDLIKWCQVNRELVKKHFPKKDRMYQLIHYGELDNYYYFKPKYTKFTPSQVFRYGCDKMPTVIGSVYDRELVVVVQDETVEITNLKEPDVDLSVFGNKVTKVYVMIDKSTGYYKIGRSNNPRTRERTLQSEKPTIEILNIYDSRVKDERALHEMFKEKRVRGEWFDLSGSDIQKINFYFNQKI